MNENEDTQLTSISKARTLDEVADFWDTHSLADCWEQTKEVEFEVRAQRRRRVTLTPELYTRIETQARMRGVLPETLVNLWLAERLQAVAPGGDAMPSSVPA
jgi:hypothetical protein